VPTGERDDVLAPKVVVPIEQGAVERPRIELDREPFGEVDGVEEAALPRSIADRVVQRRGRDPTGGGDSDEQRLELAPARRLQR
jgi:hypothetical protein